MEIIDTHTHIGLDIRNIRNNLSPIEQTPTQLLDKMKNYRIKKSVIMPFPSPEAEFDPNAIWYQFENKVIVDTWMKSPEKFIPFLGVNPSSKNSIKNLQTLISLYPVQGVKILHQNIIKFSIDELINNPLMNIIKKYNIVCMIHIGTGKEKWSSIYDSTLEYAGKVAKHYPEVNFIFSHLGRVHKDITDMLSLDNVYMDTSGMSMQPWSMFLAREASNQFFTFSSSRIIEKLTDLGFADKLTWGSDEPYTSIANEIGIMEKAEITGLKKRKILHDNISKLLGL